VDRHRALAATAHRGGFRLGLGSAVPIMVVFKGFHPPSGEASSSSARASFSLAHSISESHHAPAHAPVMREGVRKGWGGSSCGQFPPLPRSFGWLASFVVHGPVSAFPCLVSSESPSAHRARTPCEKTVKVKSAVAQCSGSGIALTWAANTPLLVGMYHLYNLKGPTPRLGSVAQDSRVQPFRLDLKDALGIWSIAGPLLARAA